MAATKTVRGFVLNNELYFFGKLKKEETKSKKVVKDLSGMSLANTKLGSKNKALRFKLDSVVVVETIVKTKLYTALEDIERAKLHMATVEGKRRTADGVRRVVGREEVEKAKNKLASVKASVAKVGGDGS
ncbi:hypothetical protein Adt_42314 [Abeliophyllum distichum]|uniref:Uncharacterized protein n=1 Tax=Abeliophyllum distichum TaxID=126358 RepID=A0ABD1PSY6_9LAMI